MTEKDFSGSEGSPNEANKEYVRVDHVTRRRISADERKKIRAEDRKWITRAVLLLTLVLILVYGTQIGLRIDDQNKQRIQQRAETEERDRSQREGCDSGNVTRAYTIITADAINSARLVSPVFRRRQGPITNAAAANPIIECEKLPKARVAVADEVASEFVRGVREGKKPLVRDGGVVFLPTNSPPDPTLIP